MTKTFENKQIKLHHILLISLFITPFLVLNSKVMNKRRDKARNRMREIFAESTALRKLDFTEDTNAICDKGTDEQKEYYKTGDKEKIEINDDKIESKDNSDHINALINLIGDKGDSSENITNYAKHLIPILIFFVIAILSLPGWLICCICNCCNCCCCCCCKKVSCKLPFYIVTAVVYAFVAGINIYGLSQSNSIFVGLADTECSILKFIGEVLDGETKETKPKWDGISNIQKLFADTKTQVGKINAGTNSDLNTQKGNVINKKYAFKNGLKTKSGAINTDTNHRLSGYKLDIIQKFGTFTCTDQTITVTDYSGSTSTYTDCINEIPDSDIKTLMYGWYDEYQKTSEQLDSIMNKIESNYKDLHDNNAATSALDEGVKSIGDLRTTFDDVKDQISGIILDYSDTIDQYGKLAFKLVFSVLLIIDVGIAAFITLLFFCSFKACQNCCLKCLFKSLLHILWNILALLNFFTLLFGSFFTLFGTIGKDLIPVVEYLVSDENLNQNEPLLLGGASNYLKTCINGDGNIADKLGLDLDSLDKINELNKVKEDIVTLRTEIGKYKDRREALNLYSGEFEKRENYNTNFEILDSSTPPHTLSFYSTLDNMNRAQSGITWSKSCSSNLLLCTIDPADLRTASQSTTANKCVDLRDCADNQLTDVYNYGVDIPPIAQELNYFINIINKEKSTSDPLSIKKTLSDLNSQYTNFLNEEVHTLDIYEGKIKDITDLFNGKLGKGNIYSIINCKFIGTNVKIILKYLKKALGKNVYNVGVCLLTAGVSMSISIAFTILLNIIFNLKKETPGAERRINYAS